MVFLLVASATSWQMVAASHRGEERCCRNLIVIDSAKYQWALENKWQGDLPELSSAHDIVSRYNGRRSLTQTINEKLNGALPAATDLDKYIRNGFASRKCPKNGQYNINPMGTPPECFIHGSLSRYLK